MNIYNYRKFISFPSILKDSSFLRRNKIFCVVAATIIFSVVNARADLTKTETLSNFGTFSQLNSGVTYMNYLNVGRNACVPTSVANLLVYLDNTFTVPGLLQTGYSTVNTLAADMNTYQGANNDPNNGTYFSSEVSGLSTYLTDQGVSSIVSIVNATANPSPFELYNWLSAGYAVGIWINWDLAGAHALSLYSINVVTNEFGNAVSGTMGFIDPWGAPASDTSTAVNVTNVGFVVTSNNTLYVNSGYLGGAGGSTNDPDNPGASETGSISKGLAIFAVPEPSVWILFGLSGLALVVAYRRREQ